jgi:inositol-phosphate phosphatase / L-galactose 1-phosphate phosphatase / histidinol-phosphatase
MSDNTMEYLSTTREFAVDLARSVRPLLRQHFRAPLDVMLKEDLSPVTIADREVETVLRAAIRDTFPEHAQLGEELGGDIGEGWSWVVDPIDGTKSFICGVPLFGTLIALLHGGVPKLGVIDMPILEECWVGDSKATTWNGKLVSTSGCEEIGRARLFATSPDIFAGADQEAYERVSSAVALRRYGGDCYLYGLLASGCCDLVIEADLKLYDVMALVPVVEGSGGVITDWDGQALRQGFDGRVVAAATPALHRTALDLLNARA